VSESATTGRTRSARALALAGVGVLTLSYASVLYHVADVTRGAETMLAVLVGGLVLGGDPQPTDVLDREQDDGDGLEQAERIVVADPEPVDALQREREDVGQDQRDDRDVDRAREPEPAVGALQQLVDPPPGAVGHGLRSRRPCALEPGPGTVAAGCLVKQGPRRTRGIAKATKGL
jgi:hypothetical protein